MKPAAFRYHAPKTIDEAVATLAEVAPDDGRVLAGGQSLVPIMAFRLARPSHLVDINGIAGLDRIATANGKLSIGACVRHAAFYQPVVDGPLGRLLSTVVRHIGHHPIRTRGTFCGSLAHADPASEWCMTAWRSWGVRINLMLCMKCLCTIHSMMLPSTMAKENETTRVFIAPHFLG